jgi:AraC-like DNA-binding protein
MMFAENRHTQVMCRIVVVAILLVCALAVMAEDVTFMSNRRQWEKLPTATLMKMGNDFMNIKNMPDSGMLCYSLIANRYNENLNREELEQCIRATCWVGVIYGQHFSNQAEEYKQLLKAKDLAEKHQYHVFVPNILMDIGNLFWEQNGLKPDNELAEEALAYHKEAFWKTIDSQSLNILPVILINLNNIACFEDKLPQTAKERKAYENLVLPDTADLKPVADAINLGVELLSQGKPEQALDVFKKASVDNLKTGVFNKNNLRIMLNDFIYFTQLKMGRDADALSTLMQNRELILNEQPSRIAGIYSELTSFYRTHNNQALADKYELLWWRATDSIAQASQANSVNKVGFLYELDKMNEEHNALVLKQQHDQKMLWVVSGFLALALGLIVLLVINRGLIKQKNKVLYENNMALLAAEDERRRQAEQEELACIEAEATKYGAIRMDEQSTEELWQNIIHVMEYSQEIYDENFSVARLAELIEAKSNYVSQAINQHDSKGFPNLLAHYRIQEACRRMNDSVNYKNYTVEGFGQSVGYTSRSHFVKLFKHHTGLTPSDYMKQCRASTSPALPLSLVM